MATVEPPVVVCAYPARSYAAGFAAELRGHGITAAVVPSDHRVGEWDVLVLACDAAPAPTRPCMTCSPSTERSRPPAPRPSGRGALCLGSPAGYLIVSSPFIQGWSRQR